MYKTCCYYTQVIRLFNGCEIQIEKMKTVDNNYYIYNYDPSHLLDILQQLDLSNCCDSRYIFDSNTYTGCCNAITITLYYKNCQNIENLDKYLSSIIKSIENVGKNLPNYIVRLYCDQSVYVCMCDINLPENIRNAFAKLNTFPNLEIYRVLCDEFEDPLNSSQQEKNSSKIDITYTRITRFFSFIDKTVNVCVSREADGIVSNLDCYNIQKFTNDPNKLFYLIPIEEIPYERIDDFEIDQLQDYLFYSYQWWLTMYKIFFEYEFFSNHVNVYDLLAGLFAVKLKVNLQYFQLTVDKIYNNLKLTEEQYNNKFLNLKNSLQIDFKSIKYEYNNRTLGFDEMVLMGLFKSLISIPIHLNHSASVIRYNNIHKIILGPKNIKKIYIGHYENIVNLLKTKNIISRDSAVMSLTPELYQSYIKNLDMKDYKYLNYYLIDSLLEDIIATEPLNIQFKRLSILSLANIPHKQVDFYNQEGGTRYEFGYRKYKYKYIKLAKKIFN